MMNTQRVGEVNQYAGLQITDGSEELSGLGKSTNIPSIPKILDLDRALKIKELTSSERNAAVEMGIVPKAYKDCYFDKDRVNENIKYFYTDYGYDIKNLDKYIKTVSSILDLIRKGILPSKSWLIGAPNGFGKTSFAQELVMTMAAMEWQTVPYTSVLEIGYAMIASSKMVLKPISNQTVPRGTFRSTEGAMTYIKHNEITDFVKKPEAISGRFGYAEFISVPCLICYMSSIENREVESRVLYTILSIRASKGLPTIVMVQSSMDIYLNNDTIGKNIWSEIYSKKEVPDGCYDRLMHVACYKVSRGLM